MVLSFWSVAAAVIVAIIAAGLVAASIVIVSLQKEHKKAITSLQESLWKAFDERDKARREADFAQMDISSLRRQRTEWQERYRDECQAYFGLAKFVETNCLVRGRDGRFHKITAIYTNPVHRAVEYSPAEEVLRF